MALFEKSVEHNLDRRRRERSELWIDDPRRMVMAAWRGAAKRRPRGGRARCRAERDMGGESLPLLSPLKELFHIRGVQGDGAGPSMRAIIRFFRSQPLAHQFQSVGRRKLLSGPNGGMTGMGDPQ